MNKLKWAAVFRSFMGAVLPLVFLFAAGLLFGNLVHKHGLAGDIWWSWGFGRLDITHSTLDLFKNPNWNGRSLTGKPWVDTEWAWELFVALVSPYANVALDAGFWWVMFIATALLAPFIYFLTKQFFPKVTLIVFSALYLFPFSYLAVMEWDIRPQLVSLFMWGLLLLVLWKNNGKTWSRSMLWLLPLTLVWSAFHGDWLLSPALLLFDGAYEFVRSRFDWRFLLSRMSLLISSIISVVLFNPFHYRGLSYAIWLTFDKNINKNISEWMPIYAFRNTGNFYVVVITLALVFSLIALAYFVTRKFPNVKLFLWWLVTAFEAVMHIRMSLYLSIVSLLLLINVVYLFPSSGSSNIQKTASRARRILPYILPGVIVSMGFLVYSHSPRQYATRYYFPAPIQWLKTHAKSGLVLAPPYLGDELEVEGVKSVYVDGRADFFLLNDHRFQNYVSLISHPNNVCGFLSHRPRISTFIWANYINSTVPSLKVVKEHMAGCSSWPLVYEYKSRLYIWQRKH